MINFIIEIIYIKIMVDSYILFPLWVVVLRIISQEGILRATFFRKERIILIGSNRFHTFLSEKVSISIANFAIDLSIILRDLPTLFAQSLMWLAQPASIPSTKVKLRCVLFVMEILKSKSTLNSTP